MNWAITDDPEMGKLAVQAMREVMADGLHTPEEWAELRAWATDRKRKRAEAEAAELEASTLPAKFGDPRRL